MMKRQCIVFFIFALLRLKVLKYPAVNRCTLPYLKYTFYLLGKSSKKIQKFRDSSIICIFKLNLILGYWFIWLYLMTVFRDGFRDGQNS